MYFNLVVLSCLLALSSAGLLPVNTLPNDKTHEISTDTRILGGHDARVGQFPYVVTLSCLYSGKYYHFCGGSIINSRWILTAAHCIKLYIQYYEPLYGSLYIGAGKRNFALSEPNQQYIEAQSAFVHENYTWESASRDDVALLKLETPLQINEYVKPIKLPALHVEPEGKAVICGWGFINYNAQIRPDILQTLDVTIINREECKASISIIDPSLASHLRDTNICTGPLTGGVGACNGDSGGPAAVNVSGQEVLVGVISWGSSPCGTKGSPTVYAKVSDYVNWITDKMTAHKIDELKLNVLDVTRE